MKNLLQSYLKLWATRYLQRVKPEIIAITGSVGKTSSKDAIFCVLKEHFGKDVRKSEGNLNNETGVPVAILGFKRAPSYEATNPLGWIPIIFTAPFKSFLIPKNKILVLELAADKPGDIKYLTSFIHPKIAVLTGISPAHMAAFGNLESIIEEKAELLRALPNDGTAVLNIDDENIKKISYGGRWQKMTYAISQEADITATNIKTEIRDFKPETTFVAKTEKIALKIATPTLGKEANVLSNLAAIAIGKIYQLQNEEIVDGLKNFKSENHRMSIVEGKNGSIIIDDSYNANPTSMKSALKVLQELPAKRKIAVLGDMREIGKITDEAHELIGAYAKEVADEVVSVGKLAKKYKTKNHFGNIEKASQYLLSKVQEGDIILIKASRAIGLDKIADILKG